MSRRFAILYFLFAAAFGFSMYLLACTASISSNYQPDIGRIRWFHPVLVLVLFFIAAWFLATRDADLRLFLLIGFAECALLFLFILVSDVVEHRFAAPPAPRTFLGTLGFSLAHPRFSNRSYAAPFYSALILGILWLVYRSRSRRHERNA
jgi:hypothetical protein